MRFLELQCTAAYPSITSYPDIHKTTPELYVHYVCYIARFCLHARWKTKSQMWDGLNDTGFVYLMEKLTSFLLHSHQELKHCI